MANPNHDERGRFAAGDSVQMKGSSKNLLSIRSMKSKMGLRQSEARQDLSIRTRCA